MKKSYSLICVIIVVSYYSLFVLPISAQNLVPNPSFEEVTLSIPPINFMPARPATEQDPADYKVYIPDGWKIVAAYARGYLPREQGWGIADKGRTGNKCIYLSDAPAFPAWYSDDFPLEPNTAYLAQVYIDAEGMRFHDYVRIIFSILDKNDNCLGYEEIVSARSEDRNISSSDFGQRGWRYKEVYIRPRMNQAKMRIIIRLINTGIVYLDDISVKPLNEIEAAEYQPPYTQITPDLEILPEQRRVESTGFYRVEQVDGVWWLIDPDGLLTWSIGIQSIGNILWENPTLSKLVEEKYGGNQSLYIEDQIPRLRQWNFTTSGSWSGPAFHELNKRLISKGEKPFPSFHFIGFTTVGDQEYSVRNHDGIVNDFGEHAMVDPFNPVWRSQADEKVKNITSLYKGIPWLVGYFVDNEINFKNLTRYLYSKYCKEELIKWLNEKYDQNISALNEKWSNEQKMYRFSNFDEIGDAIPDESAPLETENDFKEFVRYLIKTYIVFTINTIRKYDSEHLIISNRFALGDKNRALEEVGNFIDLFNSYDIVCTNLYARSGGFYTPDQMALLQYIHDQTNRPLLIGEWSFHAKESNIPLDRWGGKIVETMMDRAEAYERAMKSWSFLPYMVGAHFYKWGNGYGPVGRYRGRNSGIVNDQNEPYQPFVDMITQTNHDVLHAKRMPDGHVDNLKFNVLNSLK